MTDDPPLVIGWRLTLALVVGYTIAAAVLIAALVFAVQPLAMVWLSPRALPGFTIAVPAGEVSDEAIAYTVGRFTVHAQSPSAAIFVRWDPQLTDADRLTDRFAQLARSQGGISERLELVLSDGSRVPMWHTMQASIGVEAWSTALPCGGRQLRITTSTYLRGSGRLHRRIVRSVRCHPDAASEAAIDDVPLVMTLPPGYTRADAPVGDLQLASDRKMVWARLVAGHLSPEAGAKLMEENGVLGSDVRWGAREGTQFSFEGAAPENHFYGWATTLDCRDLGASVWLMSLSRISRDDAREGQAILRQARCRAAGEAPQQWPE
jgi:hypothetical protein